jgi:hypothetical protein
VRKQRETILASLLHRVTVQGVRVAMMFPSVKDKMGKLVKLNMPHQRQAETGFSRDI